MKKVKQELLKHSNVYMGDIWPKIYPSRPLCLMDRNILTSSGSKRLPFVFKNQFLEARCAERDSFCIQTCWPCPAFTGGHEGILRRKNRSHRCPQHMLCHMGTRLQSLQVLPDLLSLPSPRDCHISSLMKPPFTLLGPFPLAAYARWKKKKKKKKITAGSPTAGSFFCTSK